jgi:hypothetical protein
MSAAYPFHVEPTALRRAREWADVPAYAFLLLCEAGRMYQGVRAHSESGSQLPKLFEYVVKAAQPGLFGGTTFRFGWPVDPPGSPHAPQRLQALADAFGVRTLSSEVALTQTDKDAGLDVCARVKLGDELPGTAFILVQCATGKNWRAKTGEPSIERWKKYIDWTAATLRAIAVPWRIGCDDDRRSELLVTTLEFELAVVLDRDRLLSGDPDARIEQPCVSTSLRQAS